MTIYMLIYVDDIIIASSEPRATNRLISELTEDFAVTDLGRLQYFLGVEVSTTRQRVLLLQAIYAQDIVRRAKMEGCKPITTPVATTEKLSREGWTLLTDEA